MKYLILILSFIVTPSQAQTSFNHAFEAGIYLNSQAYAFSLFYAPRYNFTELSDFASLSIGTHVGIGFDFIGSDNVKSLFNIQVPAVIELNIGNCATPDHNDPLGFFIGGGVSYNYSNLKYEFTSETQNSFGPYANIGIRFSPFMDYYEEVFEVSGSGFRVGYLYDISSNKQNSFVFTAFSTF